MATDYQEPKQDPQIVHIESGQQNDADIHNMKVSLAGQAATDESDLIPSLSSRPLTFNVDMVNH